MRRLIQATKLCQIWEAEHQVENNRVAIKLLNPDFRSDRAAIDDLKQEYLATKDLSHPNVIQIEGFGSVKGIPHLVLELFEAPNLKQALRDQQELVQTHLEQVVEQAALGLGHVHQQGWLHCDVKPDNYLINSDAQVKLIDFSIARRQKKGIFKLLSGKSRVQGTMSYMAPEQIRGETIDARADLYSFGCMLFELAGGRLPFTGNSTNDLLKKHLRAKPPSVVAINPNVTTDYAALISRLIAKKPEDRPPTVDAFLAEAKNLKIFRKLPNR